MNNPWRGRFFFVLMASAIALGGCSWGGQTAIEAPDNDTLMDAGSSATVYPGGRSINAVGTQVAETAMQFIGVPYQYGGRTPNGFDCSGLVYYSFQQAGIDVPRTSGEQLKAATLIDFTEARPGDLLFFRESQRVSHVAIYVGNDRFVHAPSSGKRVSVASMDNAYYREHFYRAGRF